MSNIHSLALPSSQMFVSPLKPDPRIALEEELNAQKSKLMEAKNIIDKNNSIIIGYEELVGQLKIVVTQNEEILMQHKQEICRLKMSKATSSNCIKYSYMSTCFTGEETMCLPSSKGSERRLLRTVVNLAEKLKKHGTIFFLTK